MVHDGAGARLEVADTGDRNLERCVARLVESVEVVQTSRGPMRCHGSDARREQNDRELLLPRRATIIEREDPRAWFGQPALALRGGDAAVVEIQFGGLL